VYIFLVNKTNDSLFAELLEEEMSFTRTCLSKDRSRHLIILEKVITSL